MRFFKAFLFSLVLFNSSIFASLNLPPPADLLKQASMGRSELRDVVFQMQKNIPEFTSLPQMSPYMHILPDLQKYSDQFQLEDLYPKAVALLGEEMFVGAQKWLDVRFVNQAELTFFAQYASFNSAYGYTNAIEYTLNLEKNLNLLEIAANNIDALRLVFLKTLKDPAQVDLNLRKILSEKSAKILLDTTLTNAQISFWIQKISTAEGFLSFIDTMSVRIIALKQHNANESHIYLERLSLLKQRMDLFVDTIPTATFTSLGDQVAALLMQMLVFEVPFAQGEPELAISLMRVKNVVDLTQQIMNRTTPPSSGYVEEFLKIAQLLMTELKNAGLKQQVQDFSTYLQKVIAPVLISKLSAEGQYDLLDENNQKWYFTIIQSPTNSIYAAFSDDQHFVNKSFYNVTYDVDNGVFVASQREPDMSPNPNYTIHFGLNNKGDIHVTDLYTTSGPRKYIGKRSATFPHYIGSTVTAGSLTGRYIGNIEYLDGAKKPVELILTVFSSYTLGRMNMMDANGKVILSIEYQFGSKITDSSIFLTSGQLASGTWNHLRGKIENGVFKGIMLVGGRGILTKEFELTRK